MRRQKLPFLSVYFFSCWIIVGKILSLSLVWACARTSKTGPQWIEPRSVSLLPAEKTVQVGEQFQLAASVKMGESVPMLAGKSVELEVFWFDGTSLQPIPSTQLKFISQIVSQKLSSCAPRRVIEFVWMQVEPFVPVCRRFGVVPNPNNLLTTATLINERAPHRRSILSRAC